MNGLLYFKMHLQTDSIQDLKSGPNARSEVKHSTNDVNALLPSVLPILERCNSHECVVQQQLLFQYDKAIFIYWTVSSQDNAHRINTPWSLCQKNMKCWQEKRKKGKFSHREVALGFLQQTPLFSTNQIPFHPQILLYSSLASLLLTISFSMGMIMMKQSCFCQAAHMHSLPV